jgi:glycosyltransferase involved in cell wall biosynthesis
VGPLQITLIIPSYNRAGLIGETIQSALEQTTPFSGIIVVDDASTDDTLHVLRSFGNRITVIASEKVGVQVARNKGVAAAGTAYVALCDSDDLLRPDYIQTVSTWLSHHPECDSLYVNFQTFTADHLDREKFGAAPAGYFDGARLDNDFISDIPDLYARTVSFQPLFPTGLITKKAFYQAIGGFDPLFNGVGSEDWEYTLRAIDRGNTALCHLPLALLRRHASNDSINGIRQAQGEVVVLEHALKSHSAAARYRDVLLAGIDRRRISIFETAFGTRDYATAARVLPLIRSKPANIKFRLKQCLMSLIKPVA